MLICNLRKIMYDRKIETFTQFKKDSGLAYETIKKLYNEEDLGSIKLETLTKLCDFLDVELHDLIQYKRQ